MTRLQKITTLFVLLSYSLYSQDNQPQFIEDSLESYIKTEQKLWQIPGVAVAIIKDGKVVKTIVNGVKDIESNTPLDENSLFMIGSNSKAFTSILMATLAEEKLFSLKDPVKKWLPYFKLKDPWLTEKVNVLDILSHRVGFETFQGDFLNFDNELSSEDIIKKFALIEPTYDYRETWGYFNTGYTIAGEIIKASSNKTWAEQLRTKIFTPLEMNNTLALSEEIKLATNTTLAHTLVDGKLKIIPYGDIDATAPAGSISSSIADMSKWVIALLNNGVYNETQVIPQKAIAQTIYPRSIQGNSWHPFHKSHFSLYGLGWDLQDYEGHKLIMHTGGIHGYVTSVTNVPEKNIGIVILTNTDQNYFFEALKWDILDAYLDLPRNNYSKLYRSFYERGKNREKAEKDLRLKEVAENNKTSVSLDRFEGSYKNEVYGMLTIKKGGEDQLRIDFEHHKDLNVKLMHLKNNEFYAVFNNPLYGESVFPFVIEDNNVIKFTLKLHPSVERTTYDFYKE
ncbi:serine hydrolase domain-containing protein [Psychroserpens luteolus]|uniref:serine hydrolase domain-containing protein n=1 Tax=Psychroserpens luteolus TaxID=2855840 RepID=UPI001E64B40E|nr:serine hydrolase domain-containing protein [Psychroserpens luteolus]MCD2258313.1 serine hydrolase [Psychroserpens luteolus]